MSSGTITQLSTIGFSILHKWLHYKVHLEALTPFTEQCPIDHVVLIVVNGSVRRLSQGECEWCLRQAGWLQTTCHHRRGGRGTARTGGGSGPSLEWQTRTKDQSLSLHSLGRGWGGGRRIHSLHQNLRQTIYILNKGHNRKHLSIKDTL